jgi:hypothetical protein
VIGHDWDCNSTVRITRAANQLLKPTAVCACCLVVMMLLLL